MRDFFLKTEQGRPFVTLKLASSFDGRIATATGESQWITGQEARRAVHAMRARHDAVMVGAGTARADDPSLTVRGIGVTQQPVRVVVSLKPRMRWSCTLMGMKVSSCTAGDVLAAVELLQALRVDNPPLLAVLKSEPPEVDAGLAAIAELVVLSPSLSKPYRGTAPKRTEPREVRDRPLFQFPR